MKIIKDVQIKHILTEKSKEELNDKLTSEINKLKLELDQLNFEQKKLKRKYESKQASIHLKVEEQVQKRKNRIDEINFIKKQLDILPLGSEVTEKTIQTLIEIKEGMKWSELNKPSSIIIKDNVIVKIIS